MAHFGKGTYDPNRPNHYVTMFADVELGERAAQIMKSETQALEVKLPTLAQRIDDLSESMWLAGERLRRVEADPEYNEPGRPITYDVER